MSSRITAGIDDCPCFCAISLLIVKLQIFPYAFCTRTIDSNEELADWMKLSMHFTFALYILTYLYHATWANQRVKLNYSYWLVVSSLPPPLCYAYTLCLRICIPQLIQQLPYRKHYRKHKENWAQEECQELYRKKMWCSRQIDFSTTNSPLLWTSETSGGYIVVLTNLMAVRQTKNCQILKIWKSFVHWSVWLFASFNILVTTILMYSRLVIWQKFIIRLFFHCKIYGATQFHTNPYLVAKSYCT